METLPCRTRSAVPPDTMPGIPPLLPPLHPDSPPSDEDNSPTELNSCRRLTDKPPLVKKLGILPDDSGGGSQQIRKLPLDENDWGAPDKSESTTEKEPAEPSEVEKAPTAVSSPHKFVKLPNCQEQHREPWFRSGVPRETALELLGHEPEGAFMVRESTSKPGCYALSMRVPLDFQPSGIAHYLILRTAKGFKIKGFTKEFPSLVALITHHSVMPELLPCPLSLRRYHPNIGKYDSSRDFADTDSDGDYNTLADLRQMLAELKMN